MTGLPDHQYATVIPPWKINYPKVWFHSPLYNFKAEIPLFKPHLCVSLHLFLQTKLMCLLMYIFSSESSRIMMDDWIMTKQQTKQNLGLSQYFVPFGCTVLAWFTQQCLINERCDKGLVPQPDADSRLRETDWLKVKLVFVPKG